MEKAVITGCGVVAANGIGAEAFADAVAQRRSGIGDLVSFDASDTGRERAAEIPGFDPAPFLRSPKNYLDRHSALSFAACEMAVRASGLALPDPSKGHGLSVGGMAGNMESLAAFYGKLREKGPRFAPPFLFPHTYYNTTSGLLSIEYGLNGPHAQFCSGGAAGLEAVAHAVQCVERGRAPGMIAGGAEAFSEPLFRTALARGWLSPVDGGAESCRPLADDRNGTILGEGAAFLVIESAAAARARGARVLAGIESGAIAPSVREAMARALGRTRVEAVFVSAGGYAHEDGEEAAALAELLGGVPTTAIKALTGETFGAGGPLALCAAVLTARGRALINAGSPGAGRWVSMVVEPSR